jgi:hypothetical protein
MTCYSCSTYKPLVLSIGSGSMCAVVTTTLLHMLVQVVCAFTQGYC